MLLGQGDDRRRKCPSAGLVVAEHVEAGRGRTQQDGGPRDPVRILRSGGGQARPDLAGDRVGPPDCNLERGGPLGPGQAGGPEQVFQGWAALADQYGGGGPLGDDRRELAGLPVDPGI